MDRETAHINHSFVVRIWRKEGQADWLGWVQHVRTGEEVCVRSLDDLLTFIERRAGLPAGPRPPVAHLK